MMVRSTWNCSVSSCSMRRARVSRPGVVSRPWEVWAWRTCCSSPSWSTMSWSMVYGCGLVQEEYNEEVHSETRATEGDDGCGRLSWGDRHTARTYSTVELVKRQPWWFARSVLEQALAHRGWFWCRETEWDVYWQHAEARVNPLESRSNPK